MVGRGKGGGLLMLAMEGGERFAGGGFSVSQSGRFGHLMSLGG